jgi:hypothetical protein
MKNIFILPTGKPSRLYNNNGQLHLDNVPTTSNGHTINQNIYITSDEEIKEGDWFLPISGIGWELNTPIKADTNSGYGYNNRHCKKIILTTDPDLIKDGVQAIDDIFLEWFVKNQSCEFVEINKEYLSNTGEWKEVLLPSEWEVDTKVRYKIIIPQEESKQIYYNTVGRENGKFVIKGQFNTQKEALDLANELNKKFPDLYYDWNETLIKEEPKQETLEETGEFHFEKQVSNPYPTGTVAYTAYEKGFDNGAKWQANRLYSEEEAYSLLCSMPNFYNMTIPQQVEARDKWFEQVKKK